MKKTTKLFSALTALSLALSAMPLNANAAWWGYISPDICPKSEYTIKINHSGLLGDNTELYIGGDTLPESKDIRYFTGISRYMEKDKFYVNVSSYDDISEFAETLTGIFGSGASYTADELNTEYIALTPEYTEKTGTPEMILTTSFITVTDSRLTYSEYLNAVDYCEEYGKNVYSIDYYYGAERCHIAPATLYYNEFFISSENEADITKAIEYAEGTGIEFSKYQSMSSTGSHVVTGVFNFPDDMTLEDIFAFDVKMRDETGVFFPGGAVPAIELGFRKFEVTEEDFCPETYTYNELAQMTDEQVREAFPEFFSNDRFEYFGDDSVDDSEKFNKALSSFGEYFDTSNEMRIKIKDTSDVYDETSAEYFGLPSEWAVRAYKGYFALSNAFSDGGTVGDIKTYYQPYNEYYITVPEEISSDFESYVRLRIAEEYMLSEHSEISHIFDIFQHIDEAAPAPILLGDVNRDGTAGIADSVLILQSIANPDKYSFDNVYQKRVADVAGSDGITASDALEIQKLEAGLTEKLTPPSYIQTTYISQ